MNKGKGVSLSTFQPFRFARRDFLQTLLMGLIGGKGLFANLLENPRLPLFREVAAEVGLKFHHFTGATGEYYMRKVTVLSSGTSMRSTYLYTAAFVLRILPCRSESRVHFTSREVSGRPS